MATFMGRSSSPAPEGSSLPTPYIGPQKPGGYRERLQKTSVQADEQPLRYLRDREEIERVRSLVDRAREQGADWDDQEGQAVPFVTAKRAKDFLLDAASRAEGAGKAWVSPAVSATPEGGIHFSWLVSGNRVALTISAPYEHTVCASKFRGGTSRRELLSDYGAVERVLQAFEAAAPSLPGGNRSNPR